MQKNRSGLSSTNSKQELISEMNLVEIMIKPGNFNTT